MIFNKIVIFTWFAKNKMYEHVQDIEVIKKSLDRINESF